MKTPPMATALAALLIAMSTAHCADDSYERPKVWPRPTEPPPASPVYHDVKEPVPSEADLERDAREHPATLERHLETALRSGDARQREAAVVFLLPELLQLEPRRLVDLLARLDPGPARDLRADLARQWISQDAVGALRWMKTLPSDQRRVGALEAVVTLAPHEPALAFTIAREFALEQDETVRKLLAARRH